MTHEMGVKLNLLCRDRDPAVLVYGRKEEKEVPGVLEV
jgi:hypothetical protein